jgi:hypothetical protein
MSVLFICFMIIQRIHGNPPLFFDGFIISTNRQYRPRFRLKKLSRKFTLVDVNVAKDFNVVRYCALVELNGEDWHTHAESSFDIWILSISGIAYTLSTQRFSRVVIDENIKGGSINLRLRGETGPSATTNVRPDRLPTRKTKERGSEKTTCNER